MCARPSLLGDHRLSLSSFLPHHQPSFVHQPATVTAPRTRGSTDPHPSHPVHRPPSRPESPCVGSGVGGSVVGGCWTVMGVGWPDARREPGESGGARVTRIIIRDIRGAVSIPVLVDKGWSCRSGVPPEISVGSHSSRGVLSTADGRTASVSPPRSNF